VIDAVCKSYQNDMLFLLEGALDRQAKAALLGHYDTCAACREVFERLQCLCADLKAIGDLRREQAPRVDVVEAVMNAVARTKAVERAVVPFEPRSAAKRSRTAAWFGLLAAAAAVLVLWFSVYRITREAPTAPPQARAPQEQPVAPPQQVRPKIAPPGKPASSKANFDEIKRLMTDVLYMRPTETEAKQGSDSTDIKDLTVAGVLALRRAAVSNPNARAQLAQWASLTAERARAIAESKGASLDAKVGASQVLLPAEAERILVAAVKASPEDPHLRNELAEAYSAQPEKAAQAAAQLMELSNLDPGNALAQYKLASNLFSQGDVEGATAALERARASEQASVYTQESNQDRQQALQASGAKSEVARVLTGVTAGTDQYFQILELGRQLLDHGKQAEQQGDLPTARQFYESARTFGAQIADSSNLSSEQLGGLDVQGAALDSLSQLSMQPGSAVNPDTITEQVNALVEAYNTIAAFF